MQQLKNYVMPSVVEIISYCVVAFLLLVLDNGRMIIKIVTGADSQDSTQFLKELLEPLRDSVNNVLGALNPVIVDVLLWSFVGCIIILFAFWVAMGAENIFNEKSALSNVSNKKLKQKEIITFLVRQGIRITAFFVAISLFIYFVGELFGRFSASFYRAFENASLMNIVIAILCVPAVALAIYLMVVCVRFVLLRPRIF